ncbi:MAG: hypothetical protein IJW40_08490 [Clostridia bacterium]|nr:hypothetical protein [Clostridia bacterium]
MNTENIVAFIKHGTTVRTPRENMQAGGLLIAALACIMAALVGKSNILFIICDVIVYIVSAFYLLYIFRMPKSLPLKAYIQVQMCNSLYAVIVFSVMSLEFFWAYNILFSVIMALCPCLLGAVSCLVSYTRCKREVYIKKTVKPSHVIATIAISLGAAVGVAGIRFIPWEQYGYDIAFAVISVILAACFSVMGMPMILKMYYIKKLEQRGETLG